MYRLLPSITYTISGETTNFNLSEPTIWIDTTLTVKKSRKNPNELFLNGFGYSLFRGQYHAFILLGNYNIKSGLGKLYKQHLLEPQTIVDMWLQDQKSNNDIQNRLLKFGNYLEYHMCFFNENSPLAADNLDQSKYLRLHLACDNSFGVLEIIPKKDSTLPEVRLTSAISDKTNESSSRFVQQTSVDNMSIMPQERAMFDFYLKHSKITRNIVNKDRLFGKILYRVDNIAFYYRAGFKIGSNNTNKHRLFSNTAKQWLFRTTAFVFVFVWLKVSFRGK